MRPSGDRTVTLITKSDQIGVNRTKSEMPSSTKSGTFHTRTSSEWWTKDLVRVANYSICSLGLTDMLCIATLQLTAIDNDDEVGL